MKINHIGSTISPQGNETLHIEIQKTENKVTKHYGKSALDRIKQIEATPDEIQMAEYIHSKCIIAYNNKNK